MATAPLSAPRPRLRSLPWVWPLIPLRGSFLLAAHAYHAPPTGAPQTHTPHIAGMCARSEFVGCARILSTARSCCAPLSCETFRREPATRRFVWSFAPMPTSYHRVEHQNGSGPPPVFPPASASAGIVHRLSGPTTTTHGSPPASALVRPPRRCGGLLGPCFNTGPSSRLPPHFRCFTAQWRLFRVPSRYLCAIGLAVIFSLGCFYHPFALHYQAVLLLLPHHIISHRGYHPHRLCIPTDLIQSVTTPAGLPLGLFPVRSPLLQESAFVSFPGLNDMLKSGPSSCCHSIIQIAHIAVCLSRSSRPSSHREPIGPMWGIINYSYYLYNLCSLYYTKQNYYFYINVT